METIALQTGVREVRNGRLLVGDCRTGQTVLVHPQQACCFSRGDCVEIEYSGAMTMSLPPQVNAL